MPRKFLHHLGQHLLLFFCLILLMAAPCSVPARAGGGPENVFLVVNSASPNSVAVANAFASIRNLPPINVLMLPWTASTESTKIATFRDEILTPILRAIESRKLAPQIDLIVYSSDFPWRIDFAEELPAALVSSDKFPSGSLTGMTMLYAAVQSRSPAYLDPASNRYYKPTNAAGVPAATDGFRSWYGWGQQGELTETHGNHYLLAVMLGVTSGRGNSVSEVIASLRSAAAADGTFPKGTIYFMTNSDVRTTTRRGAFTGVVAELKLLGLAGEVIAGTLPVGKRDVAGLMSGAADFDWPQSGSSILPGAICENLTSYGGIFTPGVGQTPLSEFIRAGAAGSSGTVIEPYAIQAKFPHASIHVHYARGASLAEAFYQSVQSPYQLLVVGDPLCQPWATIPKVEVVASPDSRILEPGATLFGSVYFEPRAQVPHGKSVDRFEFFVDGMRLAQSGIGDGFTLDTLPMADGYHELRVVAIESSAVESQGRWVLPVFFSNHKRTLRLKADPSRVKPAGTVRVSVAGEGFQSVVVFSMGRVLGRTTGAEATIEVPAELLGRGKVTIRATGRSGSGAANSVNAKPVTIEVTDDPT